MTTNTYLLLFFIVVLISFVACTSNSSNKTDEELYQKTIISDNIQKPKIKAGDKVTIYYCVKNGDKVIASSDQALEPSIIVIPPIDSLSKFERPLMWLGLGDSCIVQIDANEAVAELLSYQKDFKKGDKATFIYKVLKIE